VFGFELCTSRRQVYRVTTMPIHSVLSNLMWSVSNIWDKRMIMYSEIIQVESDITFFKVISCHSQSGGMEGNHKMSLLGWSGYQSSSERGAPECKRNTLLLLVACSIREAENVGPCLLHSTVHTNYHVLLNFNCTPVKNMGGLSHHRL
jgi:hypothetical protein